MRKCILITLLQFVVSFYGFSQSARTIRIDTLRKELPSLKDSARVDVLNELAKAFGTMGKNPAWDSIYKHAISANKEALKIGYKKGEAFSLLNLAASETKNPSSAEGYIKQAISIGENIKNSKILGRSYLYWSYWLKNESRIEVLRRALAYFEQSNDKEGELEANLGLCVEYTSSGKYEEGFKYCDECPRIIKQATLTPWGHEVVLWYFFRMADLYKRVGDYETSLDYLRKGNQYSQKYQLEWNMDHTIIDAFTQLGQYDSAFYYLKRFENSATPYVLKNKNHWSDVIEQLYLKTKQYDKALAIAKEGIAFFKTQKEYGYSLNGHLLAAAKACTEMKDYTSALTYASEGVKLAEKSDRGQFMMEGYELLAGTYHHLGNNTNAYFYLRKHMALKDSSLNNQFLWLLWRLNNYKNEAKEERKTSQINLLNKENQLKEQKLKQQTFVKNGLIIGILLLFLLGLLVVRNLVLKRKNERLRLLKDLEVQRIENGKKQAELEMQALRAQMNPHFIFNCLSSINRFILKNESKIASNYLTRFSRLMRMVLNNSQKPLITLEDELEMLEIYLEMERLRFKNSFDYGITYLNKVDSDNIFIPPLLLQPFCENAIWHGLMNKDGQGRLDVELSMEDNILNCVIRDNGVGREKAEELKSKTAEKEKSMGLKITTERLVLLNREKGLNTFYDIKDLRDENGNAVGTKVNLKIGFKQSVEEVV